MCQEAEAKKVAKQTLKKFEALEKEKKALVLQEESKDHIHVLSWLGLVSQTLNWTSSLLMVSIAIFCLVCTCV